MFFGIYKKVSLPCCEPGLLEFTKLASFFITKKHLTAINRILFLFLVSMLTITGIDGFFK